MLALLPRYDVERGVVDGRAFVDPDVYDIELERVFTRTWHLMGPASALDGPGAFVTSYIGEDPVVIVRRADGTVHGLLNSCRHRGMRLCMGDAGRTDALVCPYHLWHYDLDGRLTGVHGDPSTAWMAGRGADLVPVTRVEVLAGLVFASWDADATPVADAVDARRLPPPDLVAAGVRRVELELNWKVAAERIVGGGDPVQAIPTVVVDRAGPGWEVRAVHPKGPARCEVVAWSFGTGTVELAVDAGFDDQRDVVAVRLRAGPREVPDDCPRDEPDVDVLPRVIDPRAHGLYAAWHALISDDRTVRGLPVPPQPPA